MKAAYLKDSRNMFKNNFIRFISIVLIIMLGTAFFVGMNSISPSMEELAEDYMKETKIFDISLFSNLGYNSDDIKKFKENKNITEVKPEYIYDALADYKGEDIVVRFSSINDELDINKNDIFEGRNVENDKECLISSRLCDMYEYKIGDKIKVCRKDDTNILDYLKYDEFEIVGITRNPVYLSKFYGNTTLQTGELKSYIMIKEEVFKIDGYNTVNIKTDIDPNIKKFSDEYKEKCDKNLSEIEKINNEIVKEKFDKIYQESLKKIEKAESEIAKKEDALNQVNEIIANSQIEINSGISNIASVVANYYNSSELYTRANQKEVKIQELYAKLKDLESKKKNLDNECYELKYKSESLYEEIEQLENEIDKNLYKIYSLNSEELKFVELSKNNSKLFYQYNIKDSEYKTIYQDYENKQKELEQIKDSIKDVKGQVDSLQTELYNTFNGLIELIYANKNETLTQKVTEIKQAIEEVNNYKKVLEEYKVEEKLKESKREINEQKNELNKFKIISEETPLYENSGFKSLKEDLEKMDIMGKIFPVMFFVIAALVTITTMTRMIEEDRKNIGTLKALGYSKKTITSRYITYSLAAGLLGGILGILLGTAIIVSILFTSYGSLYDLPELKFNINIIYSIIGLIISLISTVFVATIITLKELKVNTADLMRPKNEANGKRILLERFTFIWKRLDFLFKVCFRNIFRYKRRLLMTLIGIAGCTALIYAGLGLQSAINSISEKQFKDIRKYDIEAVLKSDIEEEETESVVEHVKKQKDIDEAIAICQKSFTVGANGNTKDVFYVVLNSDKAKDFVQLKNRKTKKDIELTDEGVVLTEKLANILQVKAGEKMEIVDEEAKTTVKVIDVTENYLYNYVYLTPKMYERIYGQEVKYNEILVKTSEELEEEQKINLSDSIKENDNVVSVIFEKELEKEFKTSLGSLMSIVILFIGCASILSFTVLVNLNNINIEERKRELATIKLLGFYQKELEKYVFRENIILTLLGTILGLVLGMGILGIIIQAAEVETIFLVKDINIINLFVSAIITIAFTIITNLLMKKKIKNINMIDSLKSIE